MTRILCNRTHGASQFGGNMEGPDDEDDAGGFGEEDGYQDDLDFVEDGKVINAWRPAPEIGEGNDLNHSA